MGLGRATEGPDGDGRDPSGNSRSEQDRNPVPGTDHAEELGELLTRLKERRGTSFEALARRTGLTRSTAHRYCKGQTVPTSFAPLERLARACGADRREMAELFLAWHRAVESTRAVHDPRAPEQGRATGPQAGGSPGPDPEQDPGRDGAAGGGDGEAATGGGGGSAMEGAATGGGATDRGTDRGDGPPPRAPAGAGQRGSRTPEAGLRGPGPSGATSGAAEAVDGRTAGRPGARWAALRRAVPGLVRGPGNRTPVLVAGVAATVLVVVVGALFAVARDDSVAPGPGGSPSVQLVRGPAWTDVPHEVPGSFFGVTVNSTTGTMPGFDVGAVRLWDSGTRWSLLEPGRGHYDWSALDRLVAGARKASLPVLFTFGGTPEWASPYGPRTAYSDSSRVSPPDDLEDWNRFVRAVVERYRGRIDAYEMWVMAPSPRFYTGSAQTLATMTRSGAETVHEIDPGATVVCPSMGELWQAQSRQFLKDFAGSGGYQDCDVAGVKLHQKEPGQTPESVLDLTTLIDRTFHEAGVHPRLWNTGTTYRIATEDKLDARRATDYAVRFYLVGLYARYEREYFYNWGGHKIPIVLQAEGGPPTTAALEVQELQTWLEGADITGCGNGSAAGLPARVFECRFLLRAGTPGGARHRAVVRWTDVGTATMRADEAQTEVRRLNGGRQALRPGAELVIGGSPVLVEEGGAPAS